MKIGFLFGAGAEIAYGLPGGGKFALEIFRRDTLKAKKTFKDMRSKVTTTSSYASSWLPDDYMSKNVGSFGKTVFQHIIKDTITHKRDEIIEKLNDFDSIAVRVAENLKKDGVDIDEIIKKGLGDDVVNIHAKNIIEFTDEFSDGNDLFNGNYFSSLILLYIKKITEEQQESWLLPDDVRGELGKVIRSIIQLQAGALGERVIRKINDGLFKKNAEDMDILDEFGDIMLLNYESMGNGCVEQLLAHRQKDASEWGNLVIFGNRLIEEVYSSVLDYKTLIDANWHYLYSPGADWAKFCKICIFLLNVRDCIDIDTERTKDVEGYYDDVSKALVDNKFDGVFATTNYNEIADEKIGQSVSHLNGATNFWYDPYLNKVIKLDNLNKYYDLSDIKEKHILVPLLFTQSGTKPMTSIDMAKMYVDLYEQWKECDVIVVIGFGFGTDDEHINGIIRTLIDDNGKKIVIIDRDKGVKKRDFIIEKAEKLKIKNKSKLQVIFVNGNRCVEDSDKKWIDEVLENTNNA